jgi:hypothetical protein
VLIQNRGCELKTWGVINKTIEPNPKRAHGRSVLQTKNGVDHAIGWNVGSIERQWWESYSGLQLTCSRRIILCINTCSFTKSSFTNFFLSLPFISRFLRCSSMFLKNMKIPAILDSVCLFYDGPLLRPPYTTTQN